MMTNRLHVCVALFLLLLPGIAAGQSWIRLYDPALLNATGITANGTGGYLVSGEIGINATAQYKLMQIDAAGDIEWIVSGSLTDSIEQLDYPTPTLNGEYLAVGRVFTPGPRSHIVRFASDGTELGRTTLPGVRRLRLVQLGNDHWYAYGYKGGLGPASSARPYVARLSATGQVLWSWIADFPAYSAESIALTQDGDLIVGVDYLNPTPGGLVRLNQAGQVVWNLNFPTNGYPRAILPLADGNFTLWYQGTLVSTYEMIHVDDAGNVLATYPGPTLTHHPVGESIIVTSDQHFLDFGATPPPQQPDPAAPRDHYSLLKVSPTGQAVWQSFISQPYPGIYIDAGTIVENPDQSFTAVGLTQDHQDSIHTVVLHTNAQGEVVQASVAGTVYLDANGNCLQDAGEASLPGVPVVFTSADWTAVGLSGADGTYEAPLDTGAYSITVGLPAGIWQPCLLPPLAVPTADSTYAYPIGAIPLVDCPALSIDLAAARIRACTTTVYGVSYSNLGTVAAGAAYVELTLPAGLSYVSSSIPLTAQNGPVLTFDLGSVPLLGSGSFSVTVLADCDLPLGATLCAEAHIFPDTLCGSPSALWDGSTIEILAECLGDSLQFTLRNVGDENMQAARQYIVIEDEIMYKEGQFQLPAGGETMITSPANGLTQVLLAQQSAGHPAGEVVMGAVEGCNGPLSPGVVNQFAQNEAGSPVAVHCLEVQNSYDPNDKRGFPTGQGSAHRIPRGQEIDYLVRFQNTGNDTAYQVVIRDVLDWHLDPATLRAGAASHGYTLSLETDMLGRHVAVFTFANIGLVDSLTNADASNGFLQFSIGQQPGLPDGTVLENQAAIFFDYNPPILTNTTFHTIGNDSWITLLTSTYTPTGPARLRLAVAPNPVSAEAVASVAGWESEPLTLTAWDSQGRVVRTWHGTGSVHLQRGDLPAGVYVLRVENGRGAVAMGKAVVR